MIKPGSFVILFLVSGLCGRAQPAPKLNSLKPEWVQRGSKVRITFSGENLTNAGKFLVSYESDPTQTGITHGELTVKNDKTLVAKFIVASNAPPGEREVRVLTPGGVSEPVILNVSDLRELSENGTNNSLETAQVIPFPAVINGAVKAAAEVDYYRFHAKKGEQLVFDVFASRMGSPLDSSLAVLALDGKDLARNEDANGFDSLIDFTALEDGDFVIQLRDFRYQGGGDFKYRLSAGAIPYLDSIFPLGGRRGQTVEVALKGHNLGGASVLTNILDAPSPPGVTEIRAQAGDHFSNAKAFEVGDLPEFTETEPNNATNNANAIVVPVTINGQIGSPRDLDVFKFKSDKAQRLLCEVRAQRLGSSLDALLTLADAQGNVLARNDDASGMDARIDYDKFAKDQEYTLSVRDLNERGGENFGYRLSIHEPVPDFSVKFFPDIPRVSRGGHATVRCEVTRLGGFAGAVRVAFEGLPSGAYAEPLVSTAENPGTGLLVISAANDAALGSFPIKLKATGTIAEKQVSHLAEPIIPGQKPRRAKRGSRSGEDRAVDESYLTVLDAPPFLIDLLSLAAETDQDQGVAVEVRAQRLQDFTNEIELTAEGFSTDREPISKNVDVPVVKLKADQSRTKLMLNAKAGSETGTRTVVIKATATVNGQASAQYTQTFPLTVRPIPFTIASSLPRLSVAALPPELKSAAGEAVFSVKAERRAGFNGDIALSIEGLPEGIVDTFEKIPPNQSEAAVKITATAKAEVGKEISFTFLATGTFNDRIYKQRTAPIKLIVTAPNETASTAK